MRSAVQARLSVQVERKKSFENKFGITISKGNICSEFTGEMGEWLKPSAAGG
jgi:hypothetical protein